MKVTNTKLPRPVLLFVTPDNFSKDTKLAISLSKAVLQGEGTARIQIRDRNATLQDIPKLVHALLSADVPAENLIINGMKPSDILAIHPSLGIHIKEKDIPEFLPLVKAEMPKQNIVGCAIHTCETAKYAIDIFRPDYLQVGTMFATNSHPGKVPEGPGLLYDIRDTVGDDITLIAIGGICNKNVHVVMEHGADGIAVVTLLAGANDPAGVATALMDMAKHENDRLSAK